MRAPRGVDGGEKSTLPASESEGAALARSVLARRYAAIFAAAAEYLHKNRAEVEKVASR